MPLNVGSRKRSGDASTADAKRKKAMPVRRFRSSRPYPAIGGRGLARMDNAVVYGRKWDRAVSFKKTYFNSIVWTGVGSYIGAVQSFRANEIPDWANMKELFSHYRITRCKVVFTLIDNVAGDGKAFSNTRMPEIFLKENTDPNFAAPTSQVALQPYSNVVSFQMTPEKTRVEFIVNPKVLRPLAITPDNLNQGYQDVRPPFMKVIDDNIPHYGWICFIDALDSSFRMQVDIEYDVTLKNDQ